jgi:tetratricopeptide (TPR) repeat protein
VFPERAGDPVSPARQRVDELAAQGHAALESGSPEAARANLERALDGYRALGVTDRWMSAALGNLGRAYTLLGRHDDGIHVIRQAVTVKRRNREDPASLHVALSNLALALQAAGDQDGAEAALAEAAALPGLSDERRERITQEQAFHRMNRGDFAGALVALNSCLAAVLGRERSGSLPSPSRERGHLLNNMGGCYDHLQNRVEARRCYQEAIRVRRICAPGSLELANSLSNLAGLPDTPLTADERQALLAEAADLGEDVAPMSPVLSVTRAHEAGELLEAGDPRGALRLAERAIAGTPMASTYLVAALAHLDLGDERAAERMVEQAYELCLRSPGRIADLQPVLTARGTVARRRGDLDRAADCYDRAIALAERLRTGSAREEGLERWFGGTKAAYYGRIEVSFQRKRPGDARAAFRAAEAFRARTLAELLSAGRPARAAGTGTLRRLAELYAVLDDATPGDRAALVRERDRLEAVAEQDRLNMLAERPVEAEATYPVPCTVPEIQGVLDDDTTLALFQVTDDHVFLWTVTRSTFAFRRLPPSAEQLHAAVAEVLGRCRDTTSQVPPSSSLAQLGDWLAGPLSRAAGRLVICADETLSYLPFEALPGLPAGCTVSYAPSATTLVRYGRRRRADPIREFAGFAVEESGRGRRLTAAVPEIEAAAARAGGRTICCSGRKATVRAVRRYAPGSRYVHFAVHGVIRDDQPLYSALDLAGDPLYAYDLATIDLCADVVVLSACETALGAERAGEGVVGLSRALFAAGARAVLLTRWRVLDLPALTLVKAFYTCLAAGRDPADALAEAVRTVRRDKPTMFAHPREWAAFMVIDTGA